VRPPSGVQSGFDTVPFTQVAVILSEAKNPRIFFGAACIWPSRTVSNESSKRRLKRQKQIPFGDDKQKSVPVSARPTHDPQGPRPLSFPKGICFCRRS
jgi:hypothetical protein